jgi:hypothetical protein
MIGNFNTHQIIGNYINKNINDNNFDNVKFTCDDIFRNSTEDISKNKKNKISLDYYIIFYTLQNSGTFYLAVVLKDSLYSEENNLIYELFEDIDHQGIKKLVNKKGVLTHVGIQNLKFCLELYQENNRKNSENKKEKEKENEDIFVKNKNNNINKDMSKIALLNNEINDIHTNVKESVKNMITNVNEMHDLDTKSAKIKDTSYQFQKDSGALERQIRFQKFVNSCVIICILSIIFIIVIYLIIN